MKKNDVFEYFVRKPETIIEILEKVLKKYRSNLKQTNNQEVKKQLVEVSKTIERLENTGVPVPNSLRDLKTSLLITVDDIEESHTKYENIIKGLNELYRDHKKAKKNKTKTPKIRLSPQDNGKKLRLTPRHTLIAAIIQALEEMGNVGNKADIHKRIEVLLANVLNPLDYEVDSYGRIAWRRQVDWTRIYLIQNGVMKDDSPRGVWELSENYRSFLKEIR